MNTSNSSTSVSSECDGERSQVLLVTYIITVCEAALEQPGVGLGFSLN